MAMVISGKLGLKNIDEFRLLDRVQLDFSKCCSRDSKNFIGYRFYSALIKLQHNYCRYQQDGATSLFLAAQNGHSNVVALILSTAARQEASSSPSGEVMTKPVEMVNLRRVDGTTALWMAVQMGFDNIVRLLIKGGANIEISRNVS